MSSLPEETLSHEETLSQDLNKMLNSEVVDLDITIHVENKIYHAHRFILEVRSSVLSTLLKDKSEITLSEDPILFQSLLHYIYTGDLIMQIKDAFKMYELAGKYNLHDLPEEIVNATFSDWEPEEIFSLFFNPKATPKSQLFQNAKTYIEDRFERFVLWSLGDPNYQLTESNWIDILSSWEIDVEEKTVVDLVMRWEGLSPKTRNLDKIIPLLRFGLLNARVLGKGGELEYFIKDKKNLNLKTILPRSTRHSILMPENPLDFLVKKGDGEKQFFVEKTVKNAWENSKIIGRGALLPGSYIEYTIESINKNDHSGLVFGITNDYGKCLFSTCIGCGMSGGKYNLTRSISSCFGNNGDKIAVHFRLNDVVLYKNNVEIGRASYSNHEKWYPIAFIHYVGDKISYKITNKQ